jgi:hypothetical protein
MLSENGIIIEITDNLIYTVRTKNFEIYEACPTRESMLELIDLYFKDIECESRDCKKCEDVNCEQHPVQKKPKNPGRISTKS